MLTSYWSLPLASCKRYIRLWWPCVCSVQPHTLFKPVFPNFKIPPVLLTPKYSTMNSLSPAIYSEVSKYITSKTSLCTLLCYLEDWVESGLIKVYLRPNISDLLDCAKKELLYGLDVLKHMEMRIDTLLKAADSLPDPPSALLCGLRGQSNLFRDGLNDAGVKLQCTLDMLEVKITEEYEKFVTVCRHDSEINNEDVNQLAAKVLDIIFDSYLKVSEDYETLDLEIVNFHNKIRVFCLHMDNFL